jgi:signal transduction histidine kinase
MSDRSGLINPSFKIPLTESPAFVRFHKSRQSGQSFYAEEVSGDALAAHYRYMLTLPVFGDILNGFFKAGFTLPESQINNVANFSHGNLIFITYQHVPEAWDIFKRFAKVFDLTYTRFNDLKQAEAQAQKARIEAALERVRARAMSMQNSDELNELVTILFEELIKLDLVPARCIIWIFDSNTLDARVWMANAEDQSKTESCHIKRLNHPYYEAIIKGWKEKTATWVYDLHGEDKRTIDRLLLYETELSHLPEAVKKRILTSERTLISGSFNNFGLIEASGPLAHSDEQLDILYRFGKVFDLSYTRFNDLKQAEAQAKEAKIEAALERVRSKALAMQTSDDLIDVANVLREQMGNLGQPELDSSVVHLYNGDSKIFEAWYAYAHPNHSAEIITGIATVRKDATAWTQEVIDKYQSMETDYTIVSSGQKLNEHYKMLAEVANATVDYDNKGQMIIPEILYYHFSKFSGGALLMISNQEPSKESRELQKRAAAVFDLAYTRFNDLKQAEARARESKIEASLDRVRAEIASMRTTTDLEQLTPLIWNELTNLGVPFTRCGVFIMDKEKEQIQTYLSTPEGKAIAAFQLPFHTKGITEQVVRHWQSRQLFTESWDGATFMQWASSLVEQGILPSKETYLTQSPPQQLTLHFVPFLQGMLYVGNSSALNSNALDVVQAIADAFSTAYARYEDFRKLEAAKQQVEQTLTELKSAQVQLIQKEKMASLGELTAGIAHEIQNPLNFVNNFSELNKEMLAELKEEINKGNYDEVMVIAHAIDANEEKINYHGKRADAIVKGMLQHSRKNTGEKQSTDINALCDEYLRLSYHGLRAKDKTFNATLKTFFDETIDKVNIVPQDIGRVLLNLFNNAFYAVHEHLKKFGNSYDPTVLVSTKKLNDRIEIVVKDNGMGISKSLTDKIFQPFFTTKHTGQGTGLGLSLSYDIIKAHGGELNVLTEEGEGAAFIIELPLE